MTTIQYADDLCLYVQKRKYEIVIRQLTNIANLIQIWCDNKGFNLSTEKSVVSVFTRHNTPKIDQIKLGSQTFQFRNTVRYLGIILDKKTYMGSIH